MKTPLVSIVMLCWNRKEDVLESLTRIRDIEYKNLEIIVVDNCSTDGTQIAIEEQFPDVKLIKMFKNIGIEAYNIGFKNAKGKYIVILDDDSFPRKDSIERMVEKFEEDEKLGVVAFDIRNYYRYDEIINEKPDSLDKSKAVTTSNYIMSFNGAGAGVRKDVLEKVGFYPEEFFLYCNEADISFRILDNGYKIQFFHDVVAYHKYSPKNRASWRAPYYYTRNAFWLIWKNYPSYLAIRSTIHLMYDCIYHSMEQKTWIYIKAMISAFLQIKQIKGKRKPVQNYIAENLRIPFNLSFTFYK